jgi:hypothetical protein
MTRGLSGPLSDGVELAALRGRVAMVEAKLVAVRAARHRLAPEVEQLRVACLYQEDLSPSAGDRFRYGVQVGPRAVALARGRPRG